MAIGLVCGLKTNKVCSFSITDHLIFLPRVPVLPVSLQGFEHEAKQWKIEEENGSEGGEGNPEGR